MSNKIIFTSVKHDSDNRQPEKDANGYVFITLGALNVFNSAGEYYTAEGVVDILRDPNSMICKKIKSGFLRSEVGHPKIEPGMDKTAFFNRNLRVEETNTCAHIRELVLEETDIKSGYMNDKVILIKGWVKASGPKGEFLQKALDNPEENVAFSIRCFTNNTRIGGIVVKKIVQFMTWDYVGIPGINHATKWKTLSIESSDILSMDISNIANGDDIDECYGCSLESEDERAMVNEIIHNTNAVSKIQNNIIDKW